MAGKKRMSCISPSAVEPVFFQTGNIRRPGSVIALSLSADPAVRCKSAAGHRLRVYVPYGRDSYPYSMRRLRENPEVARHVLKALVAGR
jgi:hypothetical protein